MSFPAWVALSAKSGRAHAHQDFPPSRRREIEVEELERREALSGRGSPTFARTAALMRIGASR